MSGVLDERENPQRGDLIKAMRFAASHLLSPSSDASALDAVLAHLGDTMSVDRVYVVRLQHAPRHPWMSHQIHEWVNPCIAPRYNGPGQQANAPEQQDMLLALVGRERWSQRLEQGLPVTGRVCDLPDSEQQTLASHDILSLAVVPIRINGALWGVIGLDDTTVSRHWTTIELDALQTIGDIIGAGLTTIQAYQRLDELAYYDDLTGLPNRALLLDRAKHARRRAKRFGHSLAVLLLDLDRFKMINETLGLHQGDALLRQVSQRLTNSLRAADTVARLGGDEFVVLLEDLHIPQDAMLTARKLLDSFQAPFQLADQTLFVTTSIGISLFPNDAHHIPELLECAEAAMYRAKARGRNHYDFYTHELTAAAQARLMLETELRYALDREEFVVHYQPIVATASGRIVGAEALVRWQHPRHGLLAPGEFLEATEASGLMASLGHWVLSESCAQLKAWRDAGLNLERLAVNLAGAQIDSGRLVTEVEHVLAANGLPARCLELEVTETFIMQRAERAIEALTLLKEQGISLAIDDFGTGYSSLSYLKRLPIHKLKIDQSFMRDIPTVGSDAAIVRAIIALAHRLGLTVTAEGVETQEQRRFLIDEGCDELQGYLISRPLPAADFAAFLTASASPGPSSSV